MVDRIEQICLPTEVKPDEGHDRQFEPPDLLQVFECCQSVLSVNYLDWRYPAGSHDSSDSPGGKLALPIRLRCPPTSTRSTSFTIRPRRSSVLVSMFTITAVGSHPGWRRSRYSADARLLTLRSDHG